MSVTNSCADITVDRPVYQSRFEYQKYPLQSHLKCQKLHTGMAIIRAIVAGERDPMVLASYRDPRCHASAETIRQALVGNDREEHIFALTQALELYDVYQAKVALCDVRHRGCVETAAEGLVHPCRQTADHTDNAEAIQ